MSYVKHNKIKNTAILYELLSRQITVDVLNDTKALNQYQCLKNFFKKILKWEKNMNYILF